MIDPKLEKYRERQDESDGVEKRLGYTPRTLEEFVGVVRRTPKSVLSAGDRKRIAAVMSFEERTVGELMVPKEEMIFVNDKEMLGPLVLDKLYKSGFTNFPVVDAKGKVRGVIHTEALNALEIRKMDKAEKYIDKKVNYLKATDSLLVVVEEIERTNGYYFLVRDSKERLVGFFTVSILLKYLGV